MATDQPTNETGNGARLQLKIWHPNCWTLEVTESNPGGLLGHGVHDINGSATGRFTAYARTAEELESLVNGIEKSELTDMVWEVEQKLATDVLTPGKENATSGLLVRYDMEHSINGDLISHGFIPDEPVRMTEGFEYWTVVIHEDREEIFARLEEIREEKSAEIEVEFLTSLEQGMKNGMFRKDRLSERQREVFELARSKNYYSWPREVSAADLASELDISEATFLEHLRKAEAKLLGPKNE